MKRSLALVLMVSVFLIGATALAAPRAKVIVPPTTTSLTVAHAGAGSGTTNPGVGTYTVTIGSTGSITAAPSSGSYFGGWNLNIGSGTSVFNSPFYAYSATIPSATIVATATFDTAGYDLVTNVKGNGTVKPPTGSYAFSTGLQIPLTATAAGTSVFDHWEDAAGNSLGSTNPTTVTMNAAATYVAVFVDPYAITGGIVINSNKYATNSADVTLGLTWGGGAGGGVARMRFSDDGATWSAWETLKATRSYTLPAGDGYHTVRVQYLDKAGNRSAAFNDYIRLDTTLPTGTISINNGAWSVSGAAVSLSLTWDDGAGSGVNQMRFSNDGMHWSAWQTPESPHAYTLPGPVGYNTVRVQFRDRAGNYSAATNDYIKLLSL